MTSSKTYVLRLYLDKKSVMPHLHGILQDPVSDDTYAFKNMDDLMSLLGKMILNDMGSLNALNDKDNNQLFQ